ncbi:hypothetical protein [Trinickia violacea]|nr:hypothetical protein [Trinickia violacea]
MTKGIAAVAGFKGAGALEDLVEKKKEEEASNTDNTEGSQPQA